ncbi:MAG: Uma2 family endonuclease [Saprospiraceae bacterium]|nr:Uma2 family endonuclease [Saprospiraceae bacterium]
MVATSVQERKYTPTNSQNGHAPQKISLAEFQKKFLSRKDNFKYEWVSGNIEKAPRIVNRNQTLIIHRLQRLFLTTKAHQEMSELVAELDMFLPTINRTRRADFGVLTAKQVIASANDDMSPARFVIEIISKNDQINEVGQKLIEYFNNGIEVVWVIFPKLKKVEVYRSLRDISICFDSDICSASPVLPDFQISVDKLL